jgi:phosphoglycolate phosphatase-like HAD superfamily hydrolase
MHQQHPTASTIHPPITTILFDFDGTLIDHFQTFYRSCKHALETLGFPVPNFDFIKRSSSGTLQHVMGIYLGPTSDEVLQSACDIFRQHYTQNITEGVYPLPGSECLLQKLHQAGYQLGVHTNKKGTATRLLCEHLNWTHWFQSIQGAEDTPWSKPDARCTQALLQKLGADPAGTVMIGDSPYDVETAQQAGLRCYTVATGTHSQQELTAANPGEHNYQNLFELAQSLFHLDIS